MWNESGNRNMSNLLRYEVQKKEKNATFIPIKSPLQETTKIPLFFFRIKFKKYNGI
jgi:hypothetical protein